MSVTAHSNLGIPYNTVTGAIEIWSYYDNVIDIISAPSRVILVKIWFSKQDMDQLRQERFFLDPGPLICTDDRIWTTLPLSLGRTPFLM